MNTEALENIILEKKFLVKTMSNFG